jgi:Tfp pilus assembly protein FimT
MLKIRCTSVSRGAKVSPSADGKRRVSVSAKNDLQRPTSQRGATLVEMLLATSIAAVLGSAAVPAMSDGVAQQRLRAGSSDLFATFNNARGEAVRRGVPVAVAAADERDWSAGWKVFADANDNGVQDAGEDTLVERPPIAGGVSIRPYFGATYSGRVLSYSAEGRLHRPGGQGLVIGRLVLSLDGAARSLCFASLGVRSVAAATCD